MNPSRTELLLWCSPYWPHSEQYGTGAVRPLNGLAPPYQILVPGLKLLRVTVNSNVRLWLPLKQAQFTVKMRWGWAGQVLQFQHWHPKTGIQTPRGFSDPCTSPGVSLEGRRVLAVVGCASLGLFLLHIILVSLEH